MEKHRCRFCSTALEVSAVDLGFSPLANSYLAADDLNRSESHYPMHVLVCSECFLVQLPAHETPDRIFQDYAYFSSFSDSWLQHAKQYVDKMIPRFLLSSRSQVVEIASNDGYLLQYFQQREIPILGIEPAANVAEHAQKRGIPTRVEFFGTQSAKQLATEGYQADLLLGNNVLAHVPDLNDFVAGLKIALKPEGVITMEFPHLLRLLEENQFDTIYHEHFSYFSLLTVERVFAHHGLVIFDVEEVPTHGGSLRIFARHEKNTALQVEPSIAALKQRESRSGLDRLDTYEAFRERVIATKLGLIEFLIQAKRDGKSVVAYGAPAKGNTLLNYCGISQDLIAYTVDRSPHKQGRFLPGSHLPILDPAEIQKTKPDYLLILPWNLQAEIVSQMSSVREWGCQFLVPIPELKVIS